MLAATAAASGPPKNPAMAISDERMSNSTPSIWIDSTIEAAAPSPMTAPKARLRSPRWRPANTNWPCTQAEMTSATTARLAISEIQCSATIIGGRGLLLKRRVFSGA